MEAVRRPDQTRGTFPDWRRCCPQALPAKSPGCPLAHWRDRPFPDDVTTCGSTARVRQEAGSPPDRSGRLRRLRPPHEPRLAVLAQVVRGVATGGGVAVPWLEGEGRPQPLEDLEDRPEAELGEDLDEEVTAVEHGLGLAGE